MKILVIADDQPNEYLDDVVHLVEYHAEPIDGKRIPYNTQAIRNVWQHDGKQRMTFLQMYKLWDLCGRYGVPFREDDYFPTQLSKTSPVMYEGWIGGINHSAGMGSAQTIYIGVEPNGDSHS